METERKPMAAELTGRRVHVVSGQDGRSYFSHVFVMNDDYAEVELPNVEKIEISLRGASLNTATLTLVGDEVVFNEKNNRFEHKREEVTTEDPEIDLYAYEKNVP